MKPFLSDKNLNMHNITLREGKNIITDDAETANTLNKFFDNTVKDLDINVPTSILKINERVDNGSTRFSFNKIEFSEIMLEIKNLNPKKANPFQGIPVKLLIDNSEICGEPIYNINESRFDDGLKYADITLVHT